MHTQPFHLRFQAVVTALVLVAASVVAIIGKDAAPAAVPVAGGQVLRLVQRAPLTMDAAASIDMKLTIEASSGGRSSTGHAQARINPKTRVGQATVELPGGGEVTMLQSGRTLYAPIHEDQQLIYGGKHWVSLRVNGGAPTTSASTSGLGYLQLLAGANGQVLSYGDEDVNGVTTTHYLVTVDVSEALESVPPRLRTASPEELSALGIEKLPMDIWLDAEDQVRRMRLELTAQGFEASVTIDMTPSDEAISVTIPPSDDVYKVTDAQQFAAIVAGMN